MRRRTLWGLLLIPAALTLAWAGQAGLEPGAEAPLMHFDAFNDEGGNYCITCKAGQRPAVVAFVQEDSEDVRALLTELDGRYRTLKENGLHAGVVIVGEGDHADTLQQFVSDQQLVIPTGIVSAEHKELPAWKLSDETANTVFFINRHKIAQVVADATSDAVSDPLDAITG